MESIIGATGSDYKIGNTNYVIEKGTTVLLPVYAMHHDPEIYPEPIIYLTRNDFLKQIRN